MPQNLERQRAAYPAACLFIDWVSSTLGPAMLEPMLRRESRHGELFWRVVESSIRDMTALFKPEHQSTGAADQAAAMQSMLAALHQEASKLPHQVAFTMFEEVLDAFYDQPIYPFMEHFYYLGQHGIDRLARILELLTASGLPAGAGAGRFCDIGVGPAVVFGAVLDRLADFRGDGYDVSETCVAYATRVVARRQLGHRAAIVRADGRALPAAAGTFDLVVATEVVEHVPDPEALLAEAWRVLKPGGFLIASTPVNLPWGPHLVVFRDEQEVRSLYQRARFECRAFASDELTATAALTFGLFSPCKSG